MWRHLICATIPGGSHLCSCIAVCPVPSMARHIRRLYTMHILNKKIAAFKAQQHPSQQSLSWITYYHAPPRGWGCRQVLTIQRSADNTDKSTRRTWRKKHNTGSCSAAQWPHRTRSAAMWYAASAAALQAGVGSEVAWNAPKAAVSVCRNSLQAGKKSMLMWCFQHLEVLCQELCRVIKRQHGTMYSGHMFTMQTLDSGHGAAHDHAFAWRFVNGPA